MNHSESQKSVGRGVVFPPRTITKNHSDVTKPHGGLFRPRTLAELSNLWCITALVYEPVWRTRSTRILTKGRWSIDQELHTLVAMLHPHSGGAYLDVGCSTGLYARTLASAVPDISVTLVDYSKPMLRQARKRFRLADLARANFVQADAACLPFRDGDFQGVVCGGTLNEFTEPEKVMGEMIRVLEPGGRCVVMHLCQKEKQIGLSAFLVRGVRALLRFGGVSLPDASWADELFRQAGFELVSEESAGWMRMVLLQKSDH